MRRRGEWVGCRKSCAREEMQELCMQVVDSKERSKRTGG